MGGFSLVLHSLHAPNSASQVAAFRLPCFRRNEARDAPPELVRHMAEAIPISAHLPLL